MSDLEKGDWQETWDAIFWRSLHVHRKFFLQNPRLGMLVKTFNKWPEEKQKNKIRKAAKCFEQLDAMK